MLHVNADFPHPGSIAVATDTGERVRINRRNADGTFSIVSARRCRTVPADHLVAPGVRLRAPTDAVCDDMDLAVRDMLDTALELDRLTRAMAGLTVGSAAMRDAVDYQQELIDRIRARANSASITYHDLIRACDDRIAADRRARTIEAA